MTDVTDALASLITIPSLLLVHTPPIPSSAQRMFIECVCRVLNECLLSARRVSPERALSRHIWWTTLSGHSPGTLWDWWCTDASDDDASLITIPSLPLVHTDVTDAGASLITILPLYIHFFIIETNTLSL